MRGRTRNITRIASILFAGAAIFFVCGGTWLARRLSHDLRSVHWPRATGVILQSEYLLGTWHGSHGVPSHYHYAAMTYRYPAEGSSYVSHQITFWNPDLRRHDASTFVKEHPVGSTVDVFYEPEHPANSVLMPGAATARDGIAIASAGVGALAAMWGFVRCRGRINCHSSADFSLTNNL